MRLKRIVTQVFLVLLLSSWILALRVHSGRTEPSLIVVPDNYSNVQEAINAASDGDNILVRNGTYYENIIVNKTVSLIGESKEATIINATGSHHVVTVISDDVVVRGFTVCDSGLVRAGICVEGSGCSILDNIFIRNHEGIFLDGRVSIVQDNVVYNNYFINNHDCGILIWNSHINNITSNVVENSNFGIYLFSNASMNVIGHNRVLSNGAAGVIFNLGCCNNILTNNNVSYNGYDLEIWTAGIVLAIQSNGNHIVRNNICSNRFGINQHSGSDNNAICHNNFINNTRQVYTDERVCLNIWNDDYPIGGNYWSDYSGVDFYSGPNQKITGSDGIGDNPYTIDGYNVDKYPLMIPLIDEDNFMVTPEFPSLFIMLLFMIATLFVAVFCRRKRLVC